MSPAWLVAIILLWMTMGVLTCWMRVNLSFINEGDTNTATAWMSFWLWPIWYIWVFPTWLYEQVFKHEVCITDY